MSGTREGGVKMKATLLKRLGSEEAVREFRRSIGQKGGQAKVPKGFALMDRERLREIGSRGGSTKSANYRKKV